MQVLKFKHEVVIVITTEANITLAELLAKELLNRKLAACVSLREIDSYFYWK